MDVEYFTDQDEEQAYKTISVDVTESSTIATLISKIHEITKYPLFFELKLENKSVLRTPCSYYFLNKEEDYEKIRDLEMKINEFPLSSPNGRLRIYLNNFNGIVN